MQRKTAARVSCASIKVTNQFSNKSVEESEDVDDKEVYDDATEEIGSEGVNEDEHDDDDDDEDDEDEDEEEEEDVSDCQIFYSREFG